MWYVCPLPLLGRHPLMSVCLVHRWLYVHAGILHRDLSIKNIMCRLVKKSREGKMELVWDVYGVLTDYDLSSWVDTLNPDYTKTSQQRTGTPPYMAQELLKGTSPVHLYRHDVESFFYIMLLIAARHTIKTPEGEEKPRVMMRRSRRLPFQKWFNEQSYDTLGSLKGTFFSDMQRIELSRVFEDFRPWLRVLQHCFSTGFKRKPDRSYDDLPDWFRAGNGPAVSQFDDETLGGYIKYDAIIKPATHLHGALEGLVVRDPRFPSVPAS